MKVLPHRSYEGSIVIGYTLTNEAGTSTVAKLTVDLRPRPDPADDPGVRAISDGQAETARRFASTHLGNIARRAEQRRNADRGPERGVQIVAPHHPAVNAAVQAAAATPLLGAVRRSGAEHAPAGGSRAISSPGRIHTWTAGTVVLGVRDATADRPTTAVSTSGLTAGLDITVGESLVLGAVGGYGHDTTSADPHTRVHGANWIAGMQGSARPAAGLFLDWFAGMGGLTFDSVRTAAADGSRLKGHRTGSMASARWRAAWNDPADCGGGPFPLVSTSARRVCIPSARRDRTHSPSRSQRATFAPSPA